MVEDTVKSFRTVTVWTTYKIYQTIRCKQCPDQCSDEGELRITQALRCKKTKKKKKEKRAHQ